MALYIEFSINTPDVSVRDNDKDNAITAATSKEAKKVTKGNEEQIRSEHLGGPSSNAPDESSVLLGCVGTVRYLAFDMMPGYNLGLRSRV